jgi:hypothetical protein
MHATRAPLGIDTRTDFEARARREFEMARGKIRAGFGMKMKTGMTLAKTPQLQAVIGLNRLQTDSSRKRGHESRLLAGRSLAFLEPERDEAMRGIIRRESDGDAVTGNHSNPESAHAPGELGRDLLVILERDLIATAAEDFIHAACRLNEIVARQIR